MIHLYGSTTSPYVRRIRMLLEKHPYELHPVSVFAPEEYKEITQKNPVGKIPYMVDSDNQMTLWDSALITEYLREKLRLGKPFTLAEEKELTLINEANDSAILLFQFRKFKSDEGWKHGISQRFIERIERILAYFEAHTPASASTQNPVASWLYCLLDWMEFREVVRLKPAHSALSAFYSAFGRHAIVRSTDPRI